MGKSICRNKSQRLLLRFFMVVAFASSTATHAWSLELRVENPTGNQRREVVEMSALEVYGRLGKAYGSPLVVRNAYRQQVASQLTSDSLLLIEVLVAPHSAVMLHIECGNALPTRSYVDGRQYAWRADDFTWENDLTAYRAYGPALQRSGEKAYGFDVWLKSVPHTVVADRYDKVLAANQKESELRRKGLHADADSVKRENSLHLDHGNGLDCYNVGPTLGCGAPALMVGDSIVMPYCYKSYRVLDNGPLRFTAEFVYHPTNVGEQSNLVEHRLISLDKGCYFNRVAVWYDNMVCPQKFCSGVVLHTPGETHVRLGDNYVQYADPTDNLKGHGFQIYVATLFPHGAVYTHILPDSHLSTGVYGHALCETEIAPQEKLVYYFGAAWTGSGVRNQDMWQGEIDTFMETLKHPLKVMLP